MSFHPADKPCCYFQPVSYFLSTGKRQVYCLALGTGCHNYQLGRYCHNSQLVRCCHVSLYYCVHPLGRLCHNSQLVRYCHISLTLHSINWYLLHSLDIQTVCHCCPLQGGQHSVSQRGEPVVGWQSELPVLPVALPASPAAALGPRVGRLVAAGLLEGLGRRGGLGGR